MFCPNCDTEISKEEASASEGDALSNWDWWRCPKCNWLKRVEKMELVAIEPIGGLLYLMLVSKASLDRVSKLIVW